MIQKLNHRLLFKSLISFLIIIEAVLSTQISMSNPKQFCIEPKPNDSGRFGEYVVINSKYLVLNDIFNNKAIVYTSDESGRWQRTREILPPDDLDLSNIASGFARGLELDGDVLTISAVTKNPEWLKRGFSQSQRDGISKFLYWRYLTNLKTKTPLKQIDLLVEPELESDRVRFNLLRQEKIEQFILPNMGKKTFGDNGHALGTRVALDNNLLVVGYLSDDGTGGAYLFNLAQPEAEPLNLAVENTALGSRVAVSQQFAVVGFDGHRWYFSQGGVRGRSLMTLVQNLENGSSTVVRSFGKVSLSGNILAVMNPSLEDIESSFLEVFRLDENANAHLITKRENAYRGKVENGFLVTKEYRNSNQVCIEPLPLD